MTNYYDLLGVPLDASSDEIRIKYRQLAKENNINELIGLLSKYKALGDKSLEKVIQEQIDSKTDLMKLINEAKNILLDPSKRQAYDLKLEQIPENEEVILPNISISPTSLNFGKMEPGKSVTKTFEVQNSGGPASSVHIDWEIEPSWAEIFIEVSPGTDPFPITVSIEATALRSLSDSRQKAILTVNIDDVIHKLPVSIEVVSRSVPKPVASLPSKPTPPLRSVVSKPTLHEYMKAKNNDRLVISLAPVTPFWLLLFCAYSIEPGYLGTLLIIHSYSAILYVCLYLLDHHRYKSSSALTIKPNPKISESLKGKNLFYAVVSTLVGYGLTTLFYALFH